MASSTDRKHLTMRYQIIGRRMSPPTSNRFQHITHVQWVDSNRSSGTCSRQEMVAAIEGGHSAFVQGRYSRSDVGIYEENGTKYLRTYANEYWDDNLLSLPTF